MTLHSPNGANKFRFILKVHYDEFQYKTVIVSADTTAISVCALLAAKLSLNRFTFRLFAIRRGNELHCIEDQSSVHSALLALMDPNTEKQPSIRLQVLRPPPIGTSPTMRASTLQRWLNHQIKESGLVVDDLTKDLDDGTVLCALTQSLTGTKPTYAISEKPRDTATAALRAAIDVLEKSGITLAHDAVQQFQSGASDKLCALLWSILFRYAATRKSLGSASQKKSAPGECLVKGPLSLTQCLQCQRPSSLRSCLIGALLWCKVTQV